MAIKNIHALVEKNGFSYLQGSEYITKYYNEALANQGQRNTEETLVEYVSFSTKDIIDSILPSNTIQDYLIISNDEDNIYFYGYDIDDAQVIINTNIANNDNDSIILRYRISILVELFKKLKNEFDPSYEYQHELHIPLEYVFSYIADGINKTTIYGSMKDIYVTVIPNDERYQPVIPENTIYFATQQSYTKTEIYDFITQDNNVYVAVVNLKNILPYINNDNNWVLNGIDTGIQAKAKNAMNLNIILALSKNVGSTYRLEVLSGLNNYAINDNTVLEDTYIKSPENDVFKIHCALPKLTINEEFVDDSGISINTIIKNSSILLLTSVYDAIDENTPDKEKILSQYNDGYIAMIWTYDESIDKYRVISVENDIDNNPIALDFNSITNFNNLLDYKISKIEQIHPDNFVYRHLIFEEISKSTKHTTSSLTTYPVLQNLQGTEYNNKYINNLNFTLRYINSIDGVINKDIKSILNTSETNYLKLSSTTSLNYVTNSVYKSIINNKTNYYNEYIPNYNVPVFDMSEFLIKDSNIMNRSNILSFNSSGDIYYGYIGTSFDHYDKSILHIGTSNTDINLGEFTLINQSNKSKFKKHDAISVDFTYSYINAYTSITKDLNVSGDIVTDKINWTHTKINSSDIYTTTVVPKFIYNPSNNTQLMGAGNEFNLISIDNMAGGITSLTSNPNDNAMYFNIILYNTIDGIYYYYKYNDLLEISKFIKYIGLEGRVSASRVTSDSNDIITVNSVPRYLISSANKLANNIIFESSSDTKITINTNASNNNGFYIGNAIDVIYIQKSGVNSLVLNEHKTNYIAPIWKLPLNI